MENTRQLYILAKQWTNANQKLLRKYKGQWIAYNGTDGIIAHDTDASKVIETARASGIEYIIKYLSIYTYGGLRRLGRKVVFDVFNIEFKQKDKLILFKKRTDRNEI